MEAVGCFIWWLLGKAVKLKECGIRLIYAGEYEQKHPKVLQASSCHGNKGDHRSAVGLTNIHVEIICDHTEGIKLNHPPMVWNINDNALGSQNHRLTQLDLLWNYVDWICCARY